MRLDKCVLELQSKVIQLLCMAEVIQPWRYKCAAGELANSNFRIKWQCLPSNACCQIGKWYWVVQLPLTLLLYLTFPSGLLLFNVTEKPSLKTCCCCLRQHPPRSSRLPRHCNMTKHFVLENMPCIPGSGLTSPGKDSQITQTEKQLTFA